MSAATPEPTAPGAAAGQLSGAAFSRVLRIFVAPGEVFQELARHPTFVWPILITILVSLAVSMVVSPRVDFEATFREAMAERPEAAARMSEADTERAMAVQKKIVTVMSYSAPVTVPVMLVLLSSVYFLGLKVVGSEAEFKPVLAGVSHALLPPSLVASVLLSVVAVQRQSFTAMELERLVKSNVAAFLDPSTAKPLLSFAATLDVFNAWQWVLLALGLSIVGRVSRAKGIAVVAAVWGLWTVGKVGLAAIF